jgi:AcrR family transcriptional regulator
VSPSTLRKRAEARRRRSVNERAILDAVEVLLADRSFHDLTVEDVMASTGLTRTAFYRYFPDLEALLVQRMSEVAVEIRAAADRWLEASRDPRTTIYDSALAMAEVYRRHGRLLLAYSDAATTGDRVGIAWRQTVDSFVTLCTDRIGSLGVAVGNTEETARALVGMIERYLTDTYGRQRDVPVEVAAETITIIWARTLFGEPLAASSR